jgi:hypothetical protein
LILPVVLALGLAPVAPALAAETSPSAGYNNSNAKKPEPASGTSPSKTTKKPTPAKEVEPATTSSTPTTATEPAKASTLPFTGFNLTWTVGGGLILVCAGGSIMVMQRRQRRDGGL